MSRIDELQRLFAERNTAKHWRWPGEVFDSWPAIHRALLAAREIAANEADDIDSRLRYVEVRPGRDEWRDLLEALRALDGGA